MPARVLIYGAGGHGRVTLDIVRGCRPLVAAGFIDDDPLKVGTLLDGAKVFGVGTEISSVLKKTRSKGVVLAIGNGATRRKLFAALSSKRIRIVGFVHPRAIVSPNAAINTTAMIWPGVVCNVGAAIGPSAILNSGCIVEHDVSVGAFAHIAPGAVLCGASSIGGGTWVGAGATVIQGVHIGANALIGAGAVVIRDVAPGTEGYGVPFAAQRLRQ